jgi:dihydropteroate synthase
MKDRAEHTLRFADGGSLILGPSTRVMGILNVTPDSFADGGRHATAAQAVDAASRMVDEGAEIVDVGGESSRPGARPLPVEEEAERVLPVIKGMRRRLPVRISIDTMKAEVARRALDAGADLVNDVSALRDPGMLPLLVERGVPVVLMHMRGTPRTMQRDTRYENLLEEIAGFLSDRAESAVVAGVADDKILIDPGIGFGKSTEGNLAILRRLSSLDRVGKPVLVGASRKSFIGATLDRPVQDRLEGSLAVAAFAAAEGAHVIRAHDVAATVQVVRMIDAIRRADGPPPSTDRT